MKTKIAKDPTDAQTVEEMVSINQELIDIVGKSFDSADELDAEGKKQIKILFSDNELVLLKEEVLTPLVLGEMMAQGGFNLNMSTFKMITILGKNRSIACKSHAGVKSYAKRTEITLPEPLTNEDADNPFSDS